MSVFKDKIAIVTGGASGIGRAICTGLAQHGGRLVVADINGEGARQVAAQIGGQAATLDVRDADAVQKLVTDTVAQHGRLDYMFNNAGVGITGEVRDLTLDHWRGVLDVNLKGVINGVDAAYKVMAQQGHGHIVNTASLAGLVPVPLNAPYTASKWAIVGLSASLRAEAAGLGVRVSVVCPGFVDTPIITSTLAVNVRAEDVLANNPAKPTSPEKAAQIILHGVERNRAYIVFPFSSYVLWWLYRLSPALFGVLMGPVVGQFRGIRIEQ